MRGALTPALYRVDLRLLVYFTVQTLLSSPSMASTIDFRCLDEGLGGQGNKPKNPNPDPEQFQPKSKRKRVASEGYNEEDAMEMDQPSSKRAAIPSLENPEKPIYGRPTFDGTIAGKVSGRKWKAPKQTRASSIRVSRKGSTFEQRARAKEIKKAYTERMTELKEEIRSNKVEKRKKREEREKRKQENILKSGTKFQKITNPKTLKKIAKSKQRKHLKVVPDELLKK
ncbi:hypothetical protein AMTRI_Chr08g203170 [Amborella trichopoda]|uniref:Coiled-coil domain-containing protein 86 n=1 Tax=Amborella trichopoda TaxID=13333 RepID=W1PK72_AMBTC|nr:coiled-coil domain-containing protein 86 [Amborella trichopoda]ERN08056.1 hypothetical protein AMTR_s00012p00263510 [Amborella trichopoda]|eukprot:XP_006846381.1 coiled-coil domain-containing protein 86 [Amborella trichopoda]